MNRTPQKAEQISDQGSQNGSKVAYKNAYSEYTSGLFILYIGADKLRFDRTLRSDGDIHLEYMSSVNPSDFF